MDILFNERLKELRKERNLRQQDVADCIGVTQRKVSFWEKGSFEPSLEELWKLSDFFEVSVDYLLGKKDY